MPTHGQKPHDYFPKKVWRIGVKKNRKELDRNENNGIVLNSSGLVSKAMPFLPLFCFPNARHRGLTLNAQKPTIAVAVPTYRREQVLIDTLEQLRRQEPLPHEILVIDQTQKHEQPTIEYLQNAHDEGRICWIQHSPPNLPGARNRALLETRSDIILFIDDDIEIENDFVANHLANYTDPDTIAVAGRTLQPEGHRYPSRTHPWPRIMDYIYLPTNRQTRTENIAAFSGGNHSLRVNFVKSTGGYDENYIGWAFREDSDAAIRIWKAGGKIVFDPKACVKHLAIPSGGCRIKEKSKKIPEWQVSFPAHYFAFRHFFPRTRFWLQTAQSIRKYLLRRDNVFHPWHLPWAAISFAYAFGLAALRAAQGVRSPFSSQKKQTP